jgi:hypothetical protein
LAAYAFYALALNGSADQALRDSVWAKQSALSPYGLALLGLALHEAKDSRTPDVAAKIESLAKTEQGGVYWEAASDPLLELQRSTSPEATAHALKLLSLVRPQSTLLQPAAQWLVKNRDRGYYWTSTKQTALVIYGLVDYLKTSGELEPDFAIEVEVNGKPAMKRRFGAADALAPAPVALRLDAAKLADANRLRISKSGKGRLYWSARSDYYTSQDSFSRTASGNLNIRREYFKVVPVAGGDRIVHRLEPLAQEVSTGDVIAARLTLEGTSWQYLLLEDPIPAGTEFIERTDLYELTDRPPWWSFWLERREYRDDRATFYLRSFDDRQAQFVYLLKVVNPGRFLVSPARVSPMYEPQSLATSAAATMEVR